jgi:hypothetical protein
MGNASRYDDDIALSDCPCLAPDNLFPADLVWGSRLGVDNRPTGDQGGRAILDVDDVSILGMDFRGARFVAATGMHHIFVVAVKEDSALSKRLSHLLFVKVSDHPRRCLVCTGSQVLCGIGSCDGDFLVLCGRFSAHADSANNFALNSDGDAALQRCSVGES